MITAGANACRKVEGMTGDRRISCNRKGNVLSSCVIPAYLNALETMALTEKQQENLQVREKKPGKKTMDELSMEVGIKESFKKKLVRSTWAGQSETNGRCKSDKDSRCPEVVGKWRRGKPKL